MREVGLGEKWNCGGHRDSGTAARRPSLARKCPGVPGPTPVFRESEGGGEEIMGMYAGASSRRDDTTLGRCG